MGGSPSGALLVSEPVQRTTPELTRSARALRTNATDSERLLWSHLRHIRPRFTRQFAVSHYILDFACRSLRIAIEVDGGQHALRNAEDDARTAYLACDGWKVLRFWNNDVLSNIDGVMQDILTAVSREATHPQPLPSREGS